MLTLSDCIALQCPFLVQFVLISFSLAVNGRSRKSPKIVTDTDKNCESLFEKYYIFLAVFILVQTSAFAVVVMYSLTLAVACKKAFFPEPNTDGHTLTSAVVSEDASSRA